MFRTPLLIRTVTLTCNNNCLELAHLRTLLANVISMNQKKGKSASSGIGQIDSLKAQIKTRETQLDEGSKKSQECKDTTRTTQAQLAKSKGQIEEAKAKLVALTARKADSESDLNNLREEFEQRRSCMATEQKYSCPFCLAVLSGSDCQRPDLFSLAYNNRLLKCSRNSDATAETIGDGHSVHSLPKDLIEYVREVQHFQADIKAKLRATGRITDKSDAEGASYIATPFLRSTTPLSICAIKMYIPL